MGVTPSNLVFTIVTGKFDAAPAEFQAAVSQVLGAELRKELNVEQIPAPERIAPNAIALAAAVNHKSTNVNPINPPTGTGRFVLLHDPDSSEEWGNSFRVVCYAQAPLEIEIGLDPFIAEVAWTWLLDALKARDARYTYASGTATKTLSSGFGTLESQGDGAQIELRASWTPLGNEFGTHASAWSELICLLAGFPHHDGSA